jgi:hypothetical protein
MKDARQESHMNWNNQTDPAAAPSPEPPAPVAPAVERRVGGLRRRALTALLAVGLLGVGGVAAVMAASPDPGASQAPSATQQPSGNGGSTAPTTKPNRGLGRDCPNMGGIGSSGSNGSGGIEDGSGSDSNSSNEVSGSDA